MSTDFWAGFLSGLFIAALFGYLYLGASPTVRKLRSPFRPQTVIHKTEKTPCGIVAEALAVVVAAVLIIFLALFFIALSQ